MLSHNVFEHVLFKQQQIFLNTELLQIITVIYSKIE